MSIWDPDSKMEAWRQVDAAKNRIAELERQLAEAQAEVRELGHQRTELKRCLAEAREQMGAMTKLLGEIQWSASATDEEAGCCPSCGWGMDRGHNKYCNLSALLAPFRTLAESTSPDVAE